MHVNERGKQVLYNDLRPEDAKKYYNTLVPHSQDAFQTPVQFVPSDLIIPKAFLVCELDQVSCVEY